jgi:protein-S-isoprenylcysteine O-methyltransferase Ste14
MNAYRMRPLKYPWPAVFYALAASIGVWIQTLAPLHLSEPHRLAIMGAGALSAAVGFYLIAWGAITLISKRTALRSNRSCTHLITSGPYRLTRNPIYLGYTLLTLGAGLALDNGWLAAAALVAAAATHLYVVRKEELHLLARFGYDFERYRRRTRAWI